MIWRSDHNTDEADGQPFCFEEVLRTFQDVFYTNGVDQLLEHLSRHTGCQVALVIGQDTFVYPSTPVLEPELFTPAYWQKTDYSSGFTYVNCYRSSHTDRLLLQADLYKNRRPFGHLYLIGSPDGFKETDCVLLNYASVLCTGLDDVCRRSRQIDAVLHSIREGIIPDEEHLKLLPKEGYALVLEQRITKNTQTEDSWQTTSQRDYLSYLIHHHFPKNLCYSLSDHEILLFASTEDIEGFGQKLLTVLKSAGHEYYAGVSRRYNRSQTVAAFTEASHAASIAVLLNQEKRLCFFHELGIYRLFSYPENGWPINQMLGELDSRMEDMDKDKKVMLSKTLRVFVKNNFNYQKTANQLYTHVNTIRYRIHFMEELWGVDLSSDEGRLLFSVLSKLLPLWMKNVSYDQDYIDEVNS